jgi:hypothetical protein
MIQTMLVVSQILNALDRCPRHARPPRRYSLP